MQMLSPTMIILLLNRQLYRILCKLISIGLHSVYPTLATVAEAAALAAATVAAAAASFSILLLLLFLLRHCCSSCRVVVAAVVAAVVVVVRLVVVVVALQLWIVFPRFSYTQFGQRCCSLSVEKFSCPFAARKMRVLRLYPSPLQRFPL